MTEPLRERRRKLLSVAGVLLVLGLLLSVLAVAPAGAAGAAGVCAGTVNDTLVLATPPLDDPAGPNETVSLYRGSELVVHLCQPPNGTRTLEASGHDWLNVVTASDERLRVRIVGATNGSLGTLATSGGFRDRTSGSSTEPSRR